MPIDFRAYDACAHLGEHRRVLQAVLEHFFALPNASGGILSGSTAAGGMDAHSDLDVGIVFSDDDAREEVWARRWDWEIAPWFHRFDADHVKPHFVIYLFEPGIKADICLYTQHDLPGEGGAPYAIAWDSTRRLREWQARVNGAPAPAVNWSNAVHQDERFWAWMFYVATHVARGEYYDCAVSFYMLREIVESWHARLQNAHKFNVRRVEFREPGNLRERLAQCFPRPERESLRDGSLALIALQKELRPQVASAAGCQWRTSEGAMAKVEALIASL
jgi:hypothetical protein